MAIEMQRHVIVLGLIAALAGCSKGPSVSATNASAEDVAAKVKAAGISGPIVSPGQWTTKMTIDDLSMPNVPPQMAAQMKAHMGQARTFTSCLTAKEAKRPRENFFAKGAGNCRYDHFTMDGGRIDAALTCAEGCEHAQNGDDGHVQPRFLPNGHEFVGVG